MNKEQIQADSEVQDVLERYPQVMPVFIKHRMGCIGCSMATFETISSAAEIYHLQVQNFLAELRQAQEEG